MKFTNHFNYKITEGVYNHEPSQTIQGQTVSIAQMLTRIQGGIMPTGSTLKYPDDENETQIRFSDLTDIDNARNELSWLKQQKQTRDFEAQKPEKPLVENEEKAQ